MKKLLASFDASLLLVKLSIWGMSMVSPLAFGYFGYHLLQFLFSGGSHPLLHGSLLVLDAVWVFFVELWLLLECCFYVYHRRAQKKLQAGVSAPFLPKADRQALFLRCLEVVDDPKPFLSGWFFDEPFENLRFDNVVEWLSWAFFGTYMECLREQELEEIKSYVHEIEQRKNVSFPAGRNPSVRCMRLSLEPVHALSRPLIYYALVKICDCFGWVVLRLCGFKKYCINGKYKLNYWVHISPSSSSSSSASPSSFTKAEEHQILSSMHSNNNNSNNKLPPLVFIHGIGTGLAPYLYFLLRYTQWRERPAVFMLEFPHVSSRIHFTTSASSSTASSPIVPAMNDVVEAIEEMLVKKHELRNACFVGHSLGTVFVAWMIKERPKLVCGAVLIDPVCFLLCLSDIAYNFVYKKPRRAVEWFLHYFAARELFISHTMSRHFWWYQNILFADQLPSKATVILSGKDSIVPSEAVRKYLAANKVHHYCFDSMVHAQFLTSPSAQELISQCLSGYPI